MTHPNDQEPRQDSLPPVDAVIREARESSWHLPPSAPEPVKPTPEDAAAAAAARPTPVAPPPAAAPAPAPAPVAATAAPAPAVVHDPAHGTPPAAHGHPAPAAGHGDGHAEERLGPIDVRMWGAGVLATASGLLVAICFVLATAGAGAY